MKLDRMSLISAALAILLLTGAVMAQGMHHRAGGWFGPLEYMTDVLDLTDAQQAQIKQIHQNAISAIKPLVKREHQKHQAMIELISSGKFELATAQNIANDEAQIHAKIEVQRAQMTAQAYQLLTPDQKAKLSQVLAKRQARMQQHMLEHSPETNP